MSLSLAVLGLGIMGGSVALAARSKGCAHSITGWDPCAKACSKALAGGVVNTIELKATDAVKGADLVVLACPVPVLVELALEIGPACNPESVVTDVGSTKGTISRALGAGLPGGCPFVGSHPIAGSEKSGCIHSDPSLFDGKLTVICPGSAPESAVSQVERFWQGLGSRTVRMEAAKHDLALAATSHMPHLVAFLLAGLPSETDKPFVGGGFRDTTRIAGSDPALWAGILLDNRKALVPLMDAMISEMSSVRDLLETEPLDSAGMLQKLLAKGHEFRSRIENGAEKS